MLLASVIILFVASILLIVFSSFTKKKGFYYVLFSALSIVALAVTMILSANYNNNFGGFAIISMISLVPLFITLFDFKARLNDGSAEKFSSNSFNTETKMKSAALLFQESEGRLFESVALFLSAFFVAFAGLYLGKLSPFGMLTGVPAGIVGLSVTYLRNKQSNVFDVISNTLSYVAAGMLVGQIVAVLFNSLTTSAILYAVACLVMAAYTIACVYTKERRINVMLYCVYLFLSVAIILY